MKMKKFTKNVLGLFLSLALLLGILPMAAMAADQSESYDSTKAAVLTVNKTDSAGNALKGAEYKIYKIASYTQTGGTMAIETVAGLKDMDGNSVTVDADTNATNIDVSTLTAISAPGVTADTTSFVFNIAAADHGIYLVKETTSPAGVATTNDFIVSVPMSVDVTVGGVTKTVWEYDIVADPKNSVNDASLYKTVESGDGVEIGTDNDGNQTVHVGQKLKYTITTTLPSDFYINDKTKYRKYDILDEPGAGLTLDTTSIEVKVGATDITSAVDIKTTGTGVPSGGFLVSLVNNDGATPPVCSVKHAALVAGATVTIEYEATVTASTDITNDVKIQYTDPSGSDGGKDPDPEKPNPELKSYDYAAMKVTDKEALLNGAGFVLEVKQSDSSVKYLAKQSSGTAWTEVTSIDDAYVFTSGSLQNAATYKNNGFLFIKGVKGGNHNLIEVVAPSGYQKLKDKVAVVIDSTSTTKAAVVDADDKFATVQEATDANAFSMKIVNARSFELPGTGGAGIYLYILAGIVLIGAAIFTFARSKKRA